MSGVGPLAGRHLRQNIHRDLLLNQLQNAGLCVAINMFAHEQRHVHKTAVHAREVCMITGVYMVVYMCQVIEISTSVSAL